MPNDAAARLLRENRPLFELAYRFNCRPALDLHPGHLEGVAEPALLEALAASPRGERQLSRFVANRFEVESNGWWDPSDAGQRLALLDRPRLESLIKYTGAALLCRPISRVIAREPLLRLKQALGEPLYAFATKRAPFLGAPESGDAPPTEGHADWLSAAGLRCLAACWADAPTPLLQRLKLKLAPGVEITAAPDAPRESAVRLATRLLLQEIDPGLAPCFS